jgi:hypothetical protein
MARCLKHREQLTAITFLVMRTEIVLKTSVSFIHLTRLIAQEDFLEQLTKFTALLRYTVIASYP